MSNERSGYPSVVVMGVSAAGKSSVGRALAHEIDAAFIDADDLHPRANVVKMSAGIALTDEDRMPWLDVVGRTIAASDGPVVVACSALTRGYRDRLRAAAPGIVFVHLHGSEELLAARASARVDHFMPATLLASQLAVLESLDDDEVGVTLDVAASIPALGAAAAEYVRALT